MPNFVPGSGGNNAGYAVVYPDNSDEQLKLSSYLHQANLAQQQRIDQQQKDEAAHKFALQKYYGGLLDSGNFDTGTIVDNATQELGAKALKSLTEDLDKGLSDTDIDRNMQQYLSPMIQLAQKGKLIKAGIDNSYEALKNDKDVDADALRKAANIAAFYVRDPKTGVLRPANENEIGNIDPNKNYMGDLMANNPGLFSKGSFSIAGQLKAAPTFNQKASGSYYESPGVKRKSSFDANWSYGQKLTQDKDGTYKVEAENDPITFTDQNGKEQVLNRVPKDVFDYYVPTLGKKMQFAAETIADAKKQGIDLQPGTEHFEDVERNRLWNQLNGLAAHRISAVKDVTQSPIVTKIQLGYPPNGTGKNGTGTEPPPTVDLYAPILKMASERGRDDPNNPKRYVQMNMLNSTAQKIILDIARNSVGGGTIASPYDKYGIEGKDIGVRDIYLKKNNKDGQIYIRSAGDNRVIAPLDPNSLNVPANIDIFKLAGNKSKAEAAQNINMNTRSTGATYNLGGKTITEDQLRKGAEKYKMTLEQYKKSIGL